MPVTQKNREIEIITPLGADVLLLRDMNVTEELGRLFTINLKLDSTENIQFEALLGQNVTIRLDLPKGKRYFNGYVSSISQAVDQGRYAVYEATVHPWLWFLTRTADCRIFQKLTVPNIIKQVFSELGFTDFKDRLCGSYRTWDYCVQYRETDFNFVSRLMEQEGIYYYFTHEADKHMLIMADAYGSHDIIPGYSQIPYYPPDHVAFRDEECITNWYFSKRLQPGSYVLNEFNPLTPKADLKANSNIQPGHSRSDYEVYDYPGEYMVLGEGNTYARTRIEELHAQYEQVQGQSIVRGLLCGGLFTLSNYPRTDQNREYLVVSISHSIRTETFESGDGAGKTFYTNSFNVIESKTQFHSARITPKSIVQGPQTAVVVGPKSDEIYTDKYGRVKVQFHWDRYGKSDENSSCWVRVSHPWAGKGWGSISIPRIGQEIIVDFLEGDPDQPIITGRVYHAESMPPYELPEFATMSTLKSNSSKGGGGFNEFRFEDKKGKEQIFLHGEKNQDIRIKNDTYEWIGSDRHLIVKKDQFEEVGGDKHLTVTGDQNEKVNGTVSITTGMDLQEKVGKNHAVDAGMEIHLKAGMNVVIEAGMSITLKAGSGFIVVGPVGVTIVGTPTLINSGGAAGSGSGCSAETPKPPKEADKAKPGEVDKPPPPGTPPTSSSATSSAQAATSSIKSLSPQAQVLKQAAQDGTPFCEKCEAARRAREQQGS